MPHYKSFPIQKQGDVLTFIHPRLKTRVAGITDLVSQLLEHRNVYVVDKHVDIAYPKLNISNHKNKIFFYLTQQINITNIVKAFDRLHNAVLCPLSYIPQGPGFIIGSTNHCLVKSELDDNFTIYENNPQKCKDLRKRLDKII